MKNEKTGRQKRWGSFFFFHFQFFIFKFLSPVSFVVIPSFLIFFRLHHLAVISRLDARRKLARERGVVDPMADMGEPGLAGIDLPGGGDGLAD